VRRHLVLLESQHLAVRDGDGLWFRSIEPTEYDGPAFAEERRKRHGLERLERRLKLDELARPPKDLTACEVPSPPTGTMPVRMKAIMELRSEPMLNLIAPGEVFEVAADRAWSYVLAGAARLVGRRPPWWPSETPTGPMLPRR